MRQHRYRILLLMAGLLLPLNCVCMDFLSPSPSPARDYGPSSESGPEPFTSLEVASTPTPSASASIEEPPVQPPTPQGPQPAEVGTGAVVGKLEHEAVPKYPGHPNRRLRLLALSEGFHPYEICSMDYEEGFRLLLTRNRIIDEIHIGTESQYRFDSVPAGSSLILLEAILGNEDLSKPSGFSVEAIRGCGPFAIFPGQQIEIPAYSGCWGGQFYPTEWRCPEDPTGYPTTGPARIIGIADPEYDWESHDSELALYALSKDFSPYELCGYEDPLEGVSRRNELIQRIPLHAGASFSLEAIPPGRSLLLLWLTRGSFWYSSPFGSQLLALMPGQTFDVGVLGTLQSQLVDCTRQWPIDTVIVNVPPW